MSEVAIGRVGYVIDGAGLGRQVADAKKEVRCNVCRVWFDGRDHACPKGHERPGYSEAIVKGQLNRHLYEQAGLRPKSGDFRI